MQVTAVLIAAVIHIPSYRSEVFYGGTWFSSSRKFVPSFVFAIYTREGFNSNPTICCISGYTSSFNFISYQILFLNGAVRDCLYKSPLKL
ncbi:hypothetical protein V6Z12_D06G115200 [Gossypium hirsutum]